jgi:two-component system sensor histidine kinase/response regulator
MESLLPLMDGLEATRIRSLAHDDAKRVPIIAVSAEAFEDDVEKPLEAGMNAHISKPVDIPALFTALRQLRDKRAGYERPLGSADARLCPHTRHA